MEFVGAVFVLVAITIFLIVGVLLLFTLPFRRSGISKDYAEHVVLRRFPHGKVVGARFLKGGRRWMWELDVFDQAQINRVTVDARSAAIVMVRAMSGKPYATADSKMYGHREPGF